MVPFLKQVARHYFKTGGGIASSCFVFPNRRSMVFFRKYLSEEVAASRKPMVCPAMYTMNDFFFKASGKRQTERVTLLLELYAQYRKLSPSAEPLDEFIFWGDILLGDFSDVDKYLADPHAIFANVADFKGMEGDFSFLDAGQREAMTRFLDNFREVEASPRKEGKDYKEKFLQIWNLMGRLYDAFNASLDGKGLSYEGMAYRALAARMDSSSAVDVLGEAFPGCSQFVFVGLNALTECEKKVMGKMRDARIAQFCWDYSSSLIKVSHNRSSLFMKDNVERFPQAFVPEYEERLPEVNVISVPSAAGQTKVVAGILGQLAREKREKGEDRWTDCAIVLPDEGLLMPMLNSIPEEIGDINVTMGYPMQASSFYSFMSDVADMQLHLRRKGDKWSFYYRQVYGIFSSSIFQKAAGDEEMDAVLRIKSGAKYYIPGEDFGDSALMKLIFRPVVTDAKGNDPSGILAFSEYLSDVVSHVAPRLKSDADMLPELEFARKYYVCVNNLRSAELPVLPQTYVRLLGQLLSSQSVPYEGEPLSGLQVMGPLETRALDFDNLVIMSCNEGIFPHRSVSSSFIPAELRRGFGLPTYEHQDAVWAYYFYRMIQRPGRVWLLYDSRTENMRYGEESRYIKQLHYDFNVPVNRYTARSDLVVHSMSEDIKKPEDIVQRLARVNFSATSLQNYLACPAKFYYGSIERLRPEADVSENMDNGMIGNVFHAAMQALYLGEGAMDPSFDMSREHVQEAVRSGRIKPLEEITVPYTESWIKRRKDIKAKVRALIMSELHATEVTGRDLVAEEIIVEYIVKTLERDRELIAASEAGKMKILGLEKVGNWNLDGYNFFGYIDRIDSLRDGTVRIVDYKTGYVDEKEGKVDEDNYEKVVQEIFEPGGKSKHKIALQLFIYDMLYCSSASTGGQEVVNVIYQAPGLFKEMPGEQPVVKPFLEEVKRRVSLLLKEMADPDVPFRRTDRKEICDNCDFRVICGR